MLKDSKIFVAGHSGLVGSAIVRELKRKGYTNVVGYRVELTNRYQTFTLFQKELPEYVFNAAAHAGGIMEAVEKPAEMLIDNLYIQANITDACKEFGVKKFLNIASSCIYPVDGEQPYREEQLGTGKTDENWSYAIAKLAGIELCRAYHKQYGCNFMTAIPCNMYGPNDNFGDNGHVIPMLIRKFHEADDEVIVWGTGEERREFLYSDDFAECAIMLMEKYNYKDLHDGVINIGCGWDMPIMGLVLLIKKNVNDKVVNIYFQGKPFGVKSKLMDCYRINSLNWFPKTPVDRGIRKTYEWYKNSTSNQSG
jgi:GDP-L-fucose synthase